MMDLGIPIYHYCSTQVLNVFPLEQRPKLLYFGIAYQNLPSAIEELHELQSVRPPRGYASFSSWGILAQKLFEMA